MYSSFISKFALILVVPFAIFGIGGCSTTPKYVPDATRMTPYQARKFVRENCKYELLPTGCTLCSPSSEVPIKSCHVFSDRLEIVGQNEGLYVFPFAKLNLDWDGPENGLLNLDERWRLWGPPRKTAQSMADALSALQRTSTSNDAPLESSHFEKEALAYRNAAIKPTLPEEVHKYDVQAQSAVRDKQFEDAADLYEQALSIAPWWPAGHFNRALILGKTGDYDLAIAEMKRYLLLVPGAPDARAAQDQIYDWERKTAK
jgi:tetratricopeptide (TPR) repeat protein